MIESYSDLTNSNTILTVMTLNTILANKFGLLIDSTRNEPRDLFDIWFLLQRLDKFDFDFNQVSNAFRERFGFRPSLPTLMSGLKNPSFEKNWKLRLNKQITELPDINKIIRDIKEKMQDLFV